MNPITKAILATMTPEQLKRFTDENGRVDINAALEWWATCLDATIYGGLFTSSWVQAPKANNVLIDTTNLRMSHVRELKPIIGKSGVVMMGLHDMLAQLETKADYESKEQNAGGRNRNWRDR